MSINFLHYSDGLFYKNGGLDRFLLWWIIWLSQRCSGVENDCNSFVMVVVVTGLFCDAF